MSYPVAFEIGLLRQVVQQISNQLSVASKDQFELTPFIRGYYPMSGVQSVAPEAVINHVNENENLVFVGGADLDIFGLQPTVELNGSTGYLSAESALTNDVTGTESNVKAEHRGLTIGGWFLLERGTIIEGIVTKYGDGTNKSYSLLKTAAGAIQFIVTPDGTATDTLTHTSAPAINNWNWIVARFTVGDEMSIFLNEIKATKATAVASLKNSTAFFYVGATNQTVKRFMQGSVSRVFCCEGALTDAIINDLFTRTRALYGV